MTPVAAKKKTEKSFQRKSPKEKKVSLKEIKLKGNDGCEDHLDQAGFDSLFSDIVKEVPGAFVPRDGLFISKVNDWISLPSQFCEVMGTEGLPCGHIIQALGDSDTGKTTFCIHALIEAQKAGGIAVLLDTEHKFDIDRAVDMGLDRNRLIWKKVRTIEDVFSVIVKLLNVIRERNPKIKIVLVWDSLGATPCQREVGGYGVDGEDENEKTQAAEYAPAAAKAIKAGLRKTRYFLQEMNAAFLIINQFYTRTDLSGPAARFAKKKKAYGGEGPKYYSTIMLEFTRIGSLKITRDKKIVKIGIKTQVECVKNHIAPPFKTIEIDIDKWGVVSNDRKAGSPHDET